MPYNPKTDSDADLRKIGQKASDLIRKILTVLGENRDTLTKAVETRSLTPLVANILQMPDNTFAESTLYTRLKPLTEVLRMGEEKVRLLVEATSLTGQEKVDLLELLSDFFPGGKFLSVLKELEPVWPSSFANKHIGAKVQNGQTTAISIKAATDAVNRAYSSVPPNVQQKMMRAREHPELNEILDEALQESDLNEPLKNFVATHVGAESKKRSFWSYVKTTASKLFRRKSKPKKRNTASATNSNSPVLGPGCQSEQESSQSEDENTREVEASDEESKEEAEPFADQASKTGREMALFHGAGPSRAIDQPASKGRISLLLPNSDVELIPAESEQESVHAVLGKLKVQQEALALKNQSEVARAQSEAALTFREAQIVSSAVIRAALTSEITVAESERVLQKIYGLFEEENSKQ